MKEKLKEASGFNQVKAIGDDYIDYYNKDRYQWHLAKLSSNEFYQLCTTGEYPLRIANPPKPPAAGKKPEELQNSRALSGSRGNGGRTGFWKGTQ